MSATAEAEEQTDEVSEFTKFFRYFLLAFAAIALFVGAFVIFNTFSITVAQRTREFATLRTIGASRRQVLGSVILESLVIGLLASLVGLALGVVLAEGIEALFKSARCRLPDGRPRLRDPDGRRLARGRRRHHAPRGAVPRDPRDARAADRRRARGSDAAALAVPPLHALDRRARRRRLASCALSRAMFADELGTGDRLLSIAGGVLLLFLGVAMLSSHLVRPIAAVVGLPARTRAAARRDGSRAGTRSATRSRTAATAAALMIGIALVAFIATLTNGMKASNREAIEEQVIADYVVTSLDGYTPFVAAAGDALAAARRSRRS